MKTRSQTIKEGLYEDVKKVLSWGISWDFITDIARKVQRDFPDLVNLSNKLNLPVKIGTKLTFANNEKVKSSLTGKAVEQFTERLKEVQRKYNDPEINSLGDLIGKTTLLNSKLLLIALVRDGNGRIAGLFLYPDHVTLGTINEGDRVDPAKVFPHMLRVLRALLTSEIGRF
jgi:hypothetical protein